MSWNTYPSTTFSSSALHICHLTLLVALWLKKPAPAPVDSSRKTRWSVLLTAQNIHPNRGGERAYKEKETIVQQPVVHMPCRLNLFKIPLLCTMTNYIWFSDFWRKICCEQPSKYLFACGRLLEGTNTILEAAMAFRIFLTHVNAVGWWRPFWGHVWRQVNVPLDLTPSLGAICTKYHCCVYHAII